MRQRLALILTVFLALGSAPSLAQEEKEWLKPLVGVGYGVQVKEGRTTDAELAKMKAAGLTYVRFVIPWAEVEKDDGVFVWGYFDRFVKRLRKHGMKAVIVLGGGHPQYTAYIDAPKNNIDHIDKYLTAPSSDEAVAKFAAYAATTVEHFQGDDIIWELWNEPDSDRFWAPQANVQDYIKVADAACRAIRQAVPDARIVGPGMADMPGRWGTLRAGFLGAVLQSPLVDCLDAVSLHPYRDGEKPPETVLAAHGKLQKFLRHYTPKEKPVLPVLSTEWGFTLTDTNEEEQAAYLLRSYLLNTLAGVPVSIWYEWRDAREGADDPEAHFGLLRLDGTEKPAYKALAAFMPALVGARVQKRVKIGGPDDYVLLLTKESNQSSLVFWTLGEKQGRKIKLGPKGTPSYREYPLTSMPQRVDLGTTALPTMKLTE